MFIDIIKVSTFIILIILINVTRNVEKALSNS